MSNRESPFVRPDRALPFGAYFLFEQLAGTPAGRRLLAALGLAPPPTRAQATRRVAGAVHREKKKGSALARLLPPPRLAPPVQRLPQESRGSLRGLLLGIAAGLLFFSVFLVVRHFRAARPA